MIEKNEKELENLKGKKTHDNSENIIAKLLDEKKHEKNAIISQLEITLDNLENKFKDEKKQRK